ncbi:MAG: hypothetical protein HC842_09520 [Cytophagales bacterium]|nr:hypothetical protein [Cytophagales bacterium]
MNFELNPGQNLWEVTRWLEGQPLELLAMRRAHPSMHEIFVRTVNQESQHE